MKNTICKALAGMISSFFLISCATILGQSSPELLSVRSDPEQAKIVILNETGFKIFDGVTPTSLSLDKRKGYFSGKTYTVTVSKEGYIDHTVTVNTRLNGWYIGGNLIFGGLIGWIIVDPATGAMWTLDTKEINATLLSKLGSFSDSEETGIMLLHDVPLPLRDKMVKVSP